LKFGDALESVFVFLDLRLPRVIRFFSLGLRIGKNRVDFLALILVQSELSFDLLSIGFASIRHRFRIDSNRAVMVGDHRLELLGKWPFGGRKKRGRRKALFDLHGTFLKKVPSNDQSQKNQEQDRWKGQLGFFKEHGSSPDSSAGGRCRWVSVDLVV
jgi:hypothetical protein